MRKLSLDLDKAVLSSGLCALALGLLTACGGAPPPAEARPVEAPDPKPVATAAPEPPKNPQQEAFERNFAAALNESGPRVKACFDDGKKKNPTLGGTFSAIVDITGSGAVTGAELDASSTLNDQAVVKCMLTVVKSMGPIENPTAVSSRVKYAMNFVGEGGSAASPVSPAAPKPPTSSTGPAPGASPSAAK